MVEIDKYYWISCSNDKGIELNVYDGKRGCDEWSVVNELSDVSYWSVDDNRRMYLCNKSVYNELKFDSMEWLDWWNCCYRIECVYVFGDNVLVDIAYLSYDGWVSILKKIDMDEVIDDNNDGYFKLRVCPVFRGGLVFDVRNCYLWEFCYHLLYDCYHLFYHCHHFLYEW